MDNNREVTLKFRLSDLPMLMHALAIERNCAMMGGRPTTAAQTRMEEYRKLVEQLIPDAARVFSGISWCEMGIEIEHAQSYSVRFSKCGFDWGDHRLGTPSREYGMVQVVIGDQLWSSQDRKIYRDAGCIEAVRELIHSMAPLDAVHVDLPDTDENERHRRRPKPTEDDEAAPPVPGR